MTIRCPTTGASIGYSNGSLEMNPFWLGEAKTGRFYEGTSRGTNARDRRSFRRRRRSGCYNSCGRGLTSEASSRLGATRHTSAKPIHMQQQLDIELSYGAQLPIPTRVRLEFESNLSSPFLFIALWFLTEKQGPFDRHIRLVLRGHVQQPSVAAYLARYTFRMTEQRCNNAIEIAFLFRLFPCVLNAVQFRRFATCHHLFRGLSIANDATIDTPPLSYLPGTPSTFIPFGSKKCGTQSHTSVRPIASILSAPQSK